MNSNLSILENINLLPSLDDVYKTCQSLAVLDAILMQEWQYRYFSFNAAWDDHQSMASMRDGCGSHYYLLFDRQKNSCVGKLYDKLLDVIILSDQKDLVAFEDFAKEPAFEQDATTLFFYITKEDFKWQSVPLLTDIPFLGFLANNEKAYLPWAEDYYEIEVDIESVAAVFANQSLTTMMVMQLNPDCDLAKLKDDLKIIGYSYEGF